MSNAAGARSHSPKHGLRSHIVPLSSDVRAFGPPNVASSARAERFRTRAAGTRCRRRRAAPRAAAASSKTARRTSRRRTRRPARRQAARRRSSRAPADPADARLHRVQRREKRGGADRAQPGRRSTYRQQVRRPHRLRPRSSAVSTADVKCRSTVRRARCARRGFELGGAGFGSVASIVRRFVATSSLKCERHEDQARAQAVDRCGPAPTTDPRRERHAYAVALANAVARGIFGRDVERLAAPQRRRIAAALHAGVERIETPAGRQAQRDTRRRAPRPAGRARRPRTARAAPSKRIFPQAARARTFRPDAFRRNRATGCRPSSSSRA